jgi:hypothetical protein
MGLDVRGNNAVGDDYKARHRAPVMDGVSCRRIDQLHCPTAIGSGAKGPR